MSKINWARVFTGGLLGGIVMFALGFLLYGLWLSAVFNAPLQALGRPPMQETGGMIGFILLMNLVSGILAVWLYAAVRPRLGPGPKTAACAGLLIRTFGGLLPNIWSGVMGLFPGAYLVKDIIAGLVLLVLATVIGAWVY